MILNSNILKLIYHCSLLIAHFNKAEATTFDGFDPMMGKDFFSQTGDVLVEGLVGNTTSVFPRPADRDQVVSRANSVKIG